MSVQLSAVSLVAQTANNAYNIATTSGVTANAAYDLASLAGISANNAYDLASLAGISANNAYDLASLAGISANNAYTVGYQAGLTATLAYDLASSTGATANAAYNNTTRITLPTVFFDGNGAGPGHIPSAVDLVASKTTPVFFKLSNALNFTATVNNLSTNGFKYNTTTSDLIKMVNLPTPAGYTLTVNLVAVDNATTYSYDMYSGEAVSAFYNTYNSANEWVFTPSLL